MSVRVIELAVLSRAAEIVDAMPVRGDSGQGKTLDIIASQLGNGAPMPANIQATEEVSSTQPLEGRDALPRAQAIANYEGCLRTLSTS